MLIRIVKSWDKPDLLRQTPGGAGTWGDCTFTLDPVERCDYLVALNHLPGTLTVEVPRSRVWCFVQEPPIPAYRWIEKGLPSYTRLFTQDRRLKGPKITHTHGCLPWHVGRSYDQLHASPPPAKSRDLAWITSNMAQYEGHRRRLRFLQQLQTARVPFDLFGRGFNPVADKWDGLAPYRYAVAVENHSSPDYWTEKIADCFLAGTMPLYFGATNISAYFPAESFVWIDIADTATPKLIAETIRSDRAEKNRDALAEARRRVLDEHNLFARLAALIAEDQKSSPAPSAPAPPLRLPHVPDLTSYYLNTPPLVRAWHAAQRRLGLRLS